MFESLNVIDRVGFDKHVQTLNPKQQEFVTFLNLWFTNPHHVAFVISGGPGTGKTYTVIQTLKYLGNKYRIVKLAFTRKIAQMIGGKTIHSKFRIDFQSEEIGSFNAITKPLEENIAICTQAEYFRLCRDISPKLCKLYSSDYYDPHIVVIDEIGMLPIWFLKSIVDFYLKSTKSPILFIFMGDYCQLKPIRCHYNLFSASSVLDIPRFSLFLQENKRFHLNYHLLIEQMKHFVLKKDESGLMKFVQNHFPIIENPLSFRDIKKIDIVLAYKNETIEKYNDAYLDLLPGEKIKILGLSFEFEPQYHLAIYLKPKCRVMMTMNQDKELINGTEFIFQSYDSLNDSITLIDPKSNRCYYLRRQNGQFPITLGFAVTIHRYQGQTINSEKVLFDFDQNTDLHLIYTALSRVRSMEQIYGVVNLK